jgi:hypothetical protein
MRICGLISTRAEKSPVERNPEDNREVSRKQETFPSEAILKTDLVRVKWIPLVESWVQLQLQVLEVLCLSDELPHTSLSPY